MARDGLTNESKNSDRGRRKILVLDDKGIFPDDFVDYAVQLAARLNHDVLALSADTAWEGERFSKRVEESVKNFSLRAEANGIGFESVVKKGDLGLVIEEIKVKEKRIGFVLADADMSRKKIAEHLALPVFSILSKNHNKGGKLMAGKAIDSKKRLALKTVGFGIVSAALYAAVFTHSDLVMKYFTKGGWYAAFPVATVFVFSFIHGGFASNLWSLLGIEAAPKDALRKVEQQVIQKKQKTAKKPRAYAYVNPFHRI